MQFSKISREDDCSIEVSRTFGWTMMDGEEPNDYDDAGAAAFLPATVKS